MTSLYNPGLWSLLFTSRIDIVTSDIDIFFLILASMLLSMIINSRRTFTGKECFHDLSLGLGSSAGAFYFIVVILNGYLTNNCAFYSNSSIYSLLAMIIYFV